jgi:hypothetical protein
MRLLIVALLLGTPLWAQRRQTIWHPDHCNCEMVYEVSVSDPPGAPLRFVRANRIDPAHTGLTPEAAFNATLAENRTKNMALARLVDALPRLAESATSVGEGKALKATAEYRWKFAGAGANRSLEIGIVENGRDALTATEKTSVSATLTGLPRQVSLSADSTKLERPR